MPTGVPIRSATERDVPLILRFIRELAEYERLLHECVATEESVRRTLFGNPRFAEVLIAESGGEAAGFALFFHNYSTFLAKPGIYLEDLFVRPELRGRGIGRALLVRLASRARLRPPRMGRPELERGRHPVLPFPRRTTAGPVDGLPRHRSSPRRARAVMIVLPFRGPWDRRD